MLLLLLVSVSYLTAQERIELPSDHIRAGDLAEAIPELRQADADAMLGHAPLPGIERRVSRHELLQWAAGIGVRIEAESLPESLILARAMRRLSSEQVRELVVGAVAERYGLRPAQADVEIHSFSEPLLAAEPLEFELASTLSRLGRPATLTLRWTSSSGRSGNLSFRATARVRGTYAVAREQLPARTPISAQDFTFEEGLLPGNPEEYLIAEQDLDDKELRQSIKAGAVLQKRMLAARLTVKRGDLIELRLESRAVVVRAPARAEQSGVTGEVIRCRNLQSDSIVRAVIVDSEQAKVVSLR